MTPSQITFYKNTVTRLLSIPIFLLFLASVPVTGNQLGKSTKSSQDNFDSCQGIPWPFERNQTRQELYKAFRKIPSHTLEQYLYYELTHPRVEQPQLAHLFITYLAGKEPDPKAQRFLNYLRYGAEITDEKSVPKALKNEAICKLRKEMLTKKSK